MDSWMREVANVILGPMEPFFRLIVWEENQSELVGSKLAESTLMNKLIVSKVEILLSGLRNMVKLIEVYEIEVVFFAPGNNLNRGGLRLINFH